MSFISLLYRTALIEARLAEGMRIGAPAQRTMRDLEAAGALHRRIEAFEPRSLAELDEMIVHHARRGAAAPPGPSSLADMTQAAWLVARRAEGDLPPTMPRADDMFRSGQVASRITLDDLVHLLQDPFDRITAVDSRMRIVAASPAEAAAHGSTAARMTRRHLAEFYPPEILYSHVHPAIRTAFEGGIARTHLSAARLLSEGRGLDLEIVPARDPDGLIYTVLLQARHPA